MSITSRSIKHLRIAVSRLSRDKSTEPHYHRRCGLDLSLFEPCEEKTGLSPMDRPSHDSRGKAPQRFTGYTGVPVPTTGNYFHLHLVSDSTGETLITVARAVAAQYANVTPVEHVYPLVRSQKQLDRVLDEIEEAPGIVLFTLLEKDLVGRLEADVVLVGVSRTSKTPTSIYLANRGIRTANVPLVPGIPLPRQLETLKKPLVVSLHATPERLIQVRQNRLLSMGDRDNDTYIDRQAVADEVAFARRLSAKFNWALLDVTRRSIEETAAAIMKLFTDRQRQRLAE